jgi:hypothetical protein
MAGPDPSQPYEEPGSAFTPLPGESLTIGREPVYESGCAGTVSFAQMWGRGSAGAFGPSAAGVNASGPKTPSRL